MNIQWNLIAKYISQECNSKENKLIKARIQTDSVFANLIKTLQTSTDLNERQSRPINSDKLWQEFQHKMNTEIKEVNIKEFMPLKQTTPIRHSRGIHPIYRIAAMLIMVISLSYLIIKDIKFSDKSTLAHQYKTVNIENGKRLTINLTDGSQVTVDAGSQFRYFTSYQNERHVYLKGEAYFNVACDRKHPFYVHAGNIIIRVVGTCFNVRSWDVNPEVIVTVSEGKVMIGRDDSLQTHFKTLKKGEQSTISTQGSISETIKVNAEKYFTWMQNEIYFENAKVKEVISQLERWYNLKYKFEDQQALEHEITVHIRCANINEVNQIISLITNTEVERNGKVIRFIQ